jgi:hypothetical protein
MQSWLHARWKLLRFEMLREIISNYECSREIQVNDTLMTAPSKPKRHVYTLFFVWRKGPLARNSQNAQAKLLRKASKPSDCLRDLFFFF